MRGASTNSGCRPLAAAWRGGVLVMVFAALVACRREERNFRVAPADLTIPQQRVRLTDFQPGPREPPPSWKRSFEDNAYATAEGKRLFVAFNCVGCHANGGGGMGPALMDGDWIYGGRPEQIYASIMDGRPNGMPAFGGKVWPEQAWMLAAYVRSLSGQAPLDAAPARSDHMQSKPPESSFDPAPAPHPLAPAEPKG